MRTLPVLHPAESIGFPAKSNAGNEVARFCHPDPRAHRHLSAGDNPLDRRVVQENGHLAWTSPLDVERGASARPAPPSETHFEADPHKPNSAPPWTFVCRKCTNAYPGRLPPSLGYYKALVTIAFRRTPAGGIRDAVNPCTMTPTFIRKQTSNSTSAKPASSLPTSRRSVRFELDSPQAWRVSVIGSFNGWVPGRTPLYSIGGGKWATDVELPTGQHEYRFVVDDKIEGDPKAHTFTESSNGHMNAVLIV